jgi:hypothetical protein
MPKPYDDKKHPRDTGKFTKIEGGLPSRANQPGKSQQMPAMKDDAGDGADGEDPRMAQARDQIAKQFGQRTPGQANPADVRDANALRGLGFHASVGYRRAQAATDALHSSGDIQAMHHHGKILQDAIKSLKAGGAKSEEIDKLRRGLTGLHSALTRNDRVGAHEALGQLQHGFYHSHAAFQKEYGPGGFPLIGNNLKQAEAGQAGKDNTPKEAGAAFQKGRGIAPAGLKKSEDAASSARGMHDEPKPKKPETMRDEPSEFQMFKDFVAAAVAGKTNSGQPVTVNLHMPGQAPINMKVGNNDAEEIKAMFDAARSDPTVIQLPAPVTHVHNYSDVHVEPTPVKFEATVAAPKAPVINVVNQVNPTPVQVTNNNQIDVEAKPGEMKVEVKLPERKPRELEFKTDKDGKLTGATSK